MCARVLDVKKGVMEEEEEEEEGESVVMAAPETEC